MALVKFKAPPLPNAPAQYDPQYVRQLIRVLELYFSQLDSLTPNQAQSYTANQFIGGSFSGTDVTANTIEANASTIQSMNYFYSSGDYMAVTSLDTGDIHNHRMLSDDISAANFYGGYFYGSGRYLNTPYNQLISNTNQTASSVGTAYALTYDSTDYPDGITVASGSRITFGQTGIYNITFSIQFENSNNSTEIIDIWFRYNGTDIANSDSRFGIPARKSAGVPATLIATTPYMVDVLAANDYIEIMWRVSDTNVSVKHYAATTASPGVTPAIPAVPSVIVGITFISSQFPAVTRVAPLPVFGFGSIGNITVQIR
jgi:hypothetical protein